MTSRHLATIVAGILVAGLIGCGSAGSPTPSSGAGGGGRGIVTGAVTYRQRMALPPDAIVRVSLADVSHQDVAPAPVAETTVEPEGRQVPLPFELRYDPAAIDSTHRYAVRATIERGGRLLFTTTAVAPVITGGHPTHVDLVLAAVPGERPAPGRAAAQDLAGTRWVLEELAGTPALESARPTLEFPGPGRVAGTGSCNRFFGSVALTGETISFGRLGATLMACPDPIMRQERAYLEALQDAERYELSGGELRVYTRGTTAPLRFSAAE